MRPCVTSEGDRKVYPERSHPAEAFFGMPRRLRLVAQDGLITGVIQRPSGMNYAGWDHPLSPYYRTKVTEEWLPVHPKAGQFGYRNWLGVVVGQTDQDSSLHRLAEVVRAGHDRSISRSRLLVAGWSMENMKPRDFIHSTPPYVALEGLALGCLVGMITAADLFGRDLRFALAPVLAEGAAREAVREEFHLQTQSAFEAGLVSLVDKADLQDVAKSWVAILRKTAISLFEAHALPGLSERDTAEQKKIVDAHGYLRRSFNGAGPNGKKAYDLLMLQPVAAKKKETVA